MPIKPKAKFVIPKLLGQVIDLLYDTRQTRLVEQKDITAYKEKEEALKAHIIETLPKSSQTGASGKFAQARVISKAIPAVEDWDLLYAYIKKKNRFDLLQRRLNEEAVKEMWDNGESVPGVGTFNAVTVSVTKI